MSDRGACCQTSRKTIQNIMMYKRTIGTRHNVWNDLLENATSRHEIDGSYIKVIDPPPTHYMEHASASIRSRTNTLYNMQPYLVHASRSMMALTNNQVVHHVITQPEQNNNQSSQKLHHDDCPERSKHQQTIIVVQNH